MYETCPRSRGRHHKLFICIFLMSIKSRVYKVMSVCPYVRPCPYDNLDLREYKS